MRDTGSWRRQDCWRTGRAAPVHQRGLHPLFDADNTLLSDIKESSCYSEELALRVTFIDNSCCDVDRLAYLSQHASAPGDARPDPPAWRPDPGASEAALRGRAHARAGAGRALGTVLVTYLNCG